MCRHGRIAGRRVASQLRRAPAASPQSEFKTMQASSAADAGVGTHAIPDHVPRELIRPFDFRTGLGPYPHESVAALHSGPRVFFSPTHHNAIPGPGTWVLTRAEDIRGALQDAMTFSSNVRRSNSGLSLIPLELDPPEHPKFRV